MAFVLGLTGTIGSGKTTVAQRLRQMGEARWGGGSVELIDADQLARETVAPGTPALAEVARVFGNDVLTANGTLDRRALAKIVFGDRAQLDRLNAIIHPRVRQHEIARIGAAKDRKLIVLDVPLLFETGMEELADRTMVVTLNEARRFARLKERGLREADVIARLKWQMPQSRKIQLADAVIDNSGTMDATREQLERWLVRWETEGLIPSP